MATKPENPLFSLCDSMASNLSYAACLQTQPPWRNLTVHSRGHGVFIVTSGDHPMYCLPNYGQALAILGLPDESGPRGPMPSAPGQVFSARIR